MSLSAALTAALDARPEGTAQAQDGALVVLAGTYAAAIDADRAKLAHFGPLLQSALAELGMTPRARAAILGKGAPQPGAGRPLTALERARAEHDELEERRRAHRGG